MDSILIKDWAWEAGHQEEVRWTVLRHDLGELAENISQTVSVPKRRATIHRWAQQHEVGTRAEIEQDLTDIKEYGLNAKRRGLTNSGRGSEVVRDACDDDLATLWHLYRGLSEQGELATNDDLGLVKVGAGTPVHQGEEPLNVGITQDTKRHLMGSQS